MYIEKASVTNHTPSTIVLQEEFMSRTERASESISVRPGVQVLGILKHLNYKPWFALAEFVDNSLQSYLSNRTLLEQVEGDGFQLHVEIEIEDGDTPRVIIRDNAAGIAASDYQRAFRAADVPPDRMGLSEFGMGMKSAAFWFAPRWQVRSKALGEDMSGTVLLDVDTIVGSGAETVTVKRSSARKNEHFTEITLFAPHRIPQTRTLGKIRQYLADIYRIFLRKGILRLTLNGEDVTYKDPEVYDGPRFDAPAGAPGMPWRKPIDLHLAGGVRVHGFAAIRKEGSTAAAGFGLFRRDRLIQGVTDEGWKPEEIFGRGNSFRSQRVFGELFVEGVDVSHTKDGFRLEDHEQELIPALRKALDSEPLPLLVQAERFRVRAKPADLKKIAESAAAETIQAIDAAAEETLPEIIEHVAVEVAEPAPALTATPIARRESREIQFGTESWRVVIELTGDPAVGDWLTVNESTNLLSREITLRLSLAHPFTERFATADALELEPLVRIACAIGLGQVLARRAGVTQAGVVLMNINELLREVLAND